MRFLSLLLYKTWLFLLRDFDFFRYKTMFDIVIYVLVIFALWDLDCFDHICSRCYVADTLHLFCFHKCQAERYAPTLASNGNRLKSLRYYPENIIVELACDFWLPSRMYNNSDYQSNNNVTWSSAYSDYKFSDFRLY